MLGLHLPTDRRWAYLAENDLKELLIDHAYCEQKAASNAISLIVQFPEFSELVQAMSAVAQEEMTHFAQVHQHLLKRGWELGRERKDAYVRELYKFIDKGSGRDKLLLDRLLFAAIVEARSCERFRILADTITDKELSEFYRELMISEANHYTVFLGFARKLCGRECADIRWSQWLAYETEVIQHYGVSPTMHG